MLTRRELIGAAVTSTTLSSVPRAWAASEFDVQAFARDVAELVAIDSKTGHEEGVNKVIENMATRFRSLGWTVDTPYCAERGKALVATSGKSQDRYDVMLCAHADTVQPVGNAAKYPLRLEGGQAYGAGVADDKSSLMAVYYICRALPKEVTDKLNVAVIVNPGEETGADATRKFLDEQARKTPLALVYEPGRGEVEGGAFVNVRKGCIFLTVKFHGVSAHAGNNPQDGRNAITAMALAIPRIQEVAGHHPGVTLNGDVVKGGTAVNSIADYAECTFDFRFTDDASRDAALAELRQLCAQEFLAGVRTELVEPRLSSAMALTDRSRKLIELIDQAAESLGQPRPKWLAVGGASDGNRFSGAGVATVCAMGVVGGNLHNPEKEWSDLATARPRIELSVRTLELLARAK